MALKKVKDLVKSWQLKFSFLSAKLAQGAVKYVLVSAVGLAEIDLAVVTSVYNNETIIGSQPNIQLN